MAFRPCGGVERDLVDASVLSTTSPPAAQTKGATRAQLGVEADRLDAGGRERTGRRQGVRPRPVRRRQGHPGPGEERRVHVGDDARDVLRQAHERAVEGEGLDRRFVQPGDVELDPAPPARCTGVDEAAHASVVDQEGVGWRAAGEGGGQLGDVLALVGDADHLDLRPGWLASKFRASSLNASISLSPPDTWMSIRPEGRSRTHSASPPRPSRRRHARRQDRHHCHRRSPPHRSAWRGKLLAATLRPHGSAVDRREQPALDEGEKHQRHRREQEGPGQGQRGVRGVEILELGDADGEGLVARGNEGRAGRRGSSPSAR